MIRVNILKNNKATNSAVFASEAEADAWLEREVANGSFGQNEQMVEQEDGSMVVIPAEYTVEKLDIGLQPVLAEIRAQRNALLAACDYTQLADSPLSAEQKQAYAEYRQALRDITQHVGPDGAVEWPEKPQ